MRKRSCSIVSRMRHRTAKRSSILSKLRPSVGPVFRGRIRPCQLEQYIPRELLEKLESARSSGGIQGERRVVTMLFCDVTGSAAEQLDPEEWAQIMNGTFKHLIAPVYRYEGTLARLMGDAILGFFGAPITHEDDPHQAVLAGLDIIQSIEPYRYAGAPASDSGA